MIVKTRGACACNGDGECAYTNGSPDCQTAPSETVASERCKTCDGTGDVHRADGEYLGKCPDCTIAAPSVDYVAISSPGRLNGYVAPSTAAPIIRLKGDALDEVCAPGFHLEQMSATHWWMEIESGGEAWHVNFHSKATIAAQAFLDRKTHPNPTAAPAGETSMLGAIIAELVAKYPQVDEQTPTLYYIEAAGVLSIEFAELERELAEARRQGALCAESLVFKSAQIDRIVIEEAAATKAAKERASKAEAELAQHQLNSQRVISGLSDCLRKEGDELAALKSDIARHVEIAAQYVNDAERLDALEAFSTLHQSPSFLYVVVGYALCLERSDGRKDAYYEADTVRGAIDAARSSKTDSKEAT